MMCPPELKASVRPPAQAGRFYEADPPSLRRSIERYLREAPPAPPLPATGVLGLLAPHAGYLYSGRVAASAYQVVAGQPYDVVVVLGPSHFVDFSGAALPTHAAFATPLGAVPVDQQAVAELLDKPGFGLNDAAHASEHALEVQLPFLQVALPGPFAIVPLALGRPPRAGLESLADGLEGLLGQWRDAGRRWLLVASTDTYHGYDAQACEANDARLAQLVEALDSTAVAEEVAQRELMACGWAALSLTMLLARRQGARRGLVLRRADSRGEARAGAAGEYLVGYLGAAFL